jgi:hypothetical protein
MEQSGGYPTRALLTPQRFLQLSGVKDTRPAPTRSVLEGREHTAALAAVKGRRWYAKKLLEIQEFRDFKVASRTLIQLSRRQIEQSRRRIVLTKNILAFSRIARSHLS